MHIDDIAKITELHTELKLWREARKRCEQGIFKQARLHVTDMAHGHQQQIAETILQVPREQMCSFADEQIARLCEELHAFGVDT